LVGGWAGPVFMLLTPLVGRLATDLMSNHTKTIQDFAATFVELQQSLDRGLQKYTAFAAAHIESMTMRTESMTRRIQEAVQDSGVYISPFIYVHPHTKSSTICKAANPPSSYHGCILAPAMSSWNTS
jgi:hypothetical protein